MEKSSLNNLSNATIKKDINNNAMVASLPAINSNFTDICDNQAYINYDKMMIDYNFAEINGIGNKRFSSQEEEIIQHMPVDMLNERICRCKECTHANAKQCIMRLKNKQQSKNDFCNMKCQLLFGFCNKFNASSVEDIKAAANGEM